MKNLLIKKIECPNELSLILDILFLKHKDYLSDDLYPPEFDSDLVKSSLCHESLINGQFSVWALSKNDKWDSIFIGCISKLEKINKKIYCEYLFLNTSKKGLLLISEALKFAKNNNCDRFYLLLSGNNKSYSKIKNLLNKRNFKKEFETFSITL